MLPSENGELKTKIKGVNITHQSLNYVRTIWESLQKQFSLPKHILLLHKVARGCLQILWRIPSELAAYVIQKGRESEHYFKEQMFLRVSVDGVQVFTESEAGAELEPKVGCL